MELSNLLKIIFKHQEIIIKKKNNETIFDGYCTECKISGNVKDISCYKNKMIIYIND